MAGRKNDVDNGSTNGFTDVSEEAQAVHDDPQNTEAGAVVTEELQHRTCGTVSGGGPWPADLLIARSSVIPQEVPAPVYTSHES